MENNNEKLAGKIKEYRKIKKMSQEDLANASGINISTIKKYECGYRNPKPEQIQKIADALGISISVLMPHEIISVNDVMSLLIQLEQQAGLKMSADQDENGKYIPETVSLKFSNKKANAAIADYLELVRYEKINGITFDKTKSSSDAKDRLMMYFNNLG